MDLSICIFLLSRFVFFNCYVVLLFAWKTKKMQMDKSMFSMFPPFWLSFFPIDFASGFFQFWSFAFDFSRVFLFLHFSSLKIIGISYLGEHNLRSSYSILYDPLIHLWPIFSQYDMQIIMLQDYLSVVHALRKAMLCLCHMGRYFTSNPISHAPANTCRHWLPALILLKDMEDVLYINCLGKDIGNSGGIFLMCELWTEHSITLCWVLLFLGLLDIENVWTNLITYRAARLDHPSQITKGKPRHSCPHPCTVRKCVLNMNDDACMRAHASFSVSLSPVLSMICVRGVAMSNCCCASRLG